MMGQKEEKKEKEEEKEEKKFLHKGGRTDRSIKESTRGPRGPKNDIFLCCNSSISASS